MCGPVSQSDKPSVNIAEAENGFVISVSVPNPDFEAQQAGDFYDPRRHDRFRQTTHVATDLGTIEQIVSNTFGE